MATPFVQGRLRGQRLVVKVTTECAHCHQSLHITLDDELRWAVKERGVRPLLFGPEVDWGQFTGQNIIQVY